MSVAHGIILLYQTKGDFLMENLIEEICTVCAVIDKTNISALCEPHYFEWAQEKGFGELNEREDYFHLV